MGLHEQFVSRAGKLAFQTLQLNEVDESGRPRVASRPLSAAQVRETILSVGGGFLRTPPKAEGGAAFARPHTWAWVEVGTRLAHGVLEADGWIVWGRIDWKKDVEDALFEELDLERHLALGKPEAEWQPQPPADDDPLWRDLLSRALPTSQATLVAYRPATGEVVLSARAGTTVQQDVGRLLQLCWGLDRAPDLRLRTMGRGTLPEGEPLETLRRLARARGHLVQRDGSGAIVGAWLVRSATDKIALSDPEGERGSLVATGEVATEVLRVAQEGAAEGSALEEMVTELAAPGLTVRLHDLVTGGGYGITLKTNGDVSALVRVGFYGAGLDLLAALRKQAGEGEDDETKPKPAEQDTPAARTAKALRSLEEQAWLLALALTACRDGRRLYSALVGAVQADRLSLLMPETATPVEVESLGTCTLQWEGVPEVPQPLDGKQALIPFGLGGAVTTPAQASTLAEIVASYADERDTFEQTQAFGRGVQAARSGAACVAPAHLDGELARAWAQGWQEEADRQREASAARAAARAQARGGASAEDQATRRLPIVEGLLRARHDQDGEGCWVDVGDLVEDSQGFSREQVTEALARLVALGQAERSPVGAYRPVLGGSAGQAAAPAAAPPPVAPQAAGPVAIIRPVRAALPTQEPPGEADEAPAQAPARKRRSSAEVLEQRERSQVKGAAFAAGAAAYQTGVLYDSAPADLTGPALLGWRAGWASAKRAAQGGLPVADHAEDLAALPAHRRLGRASLEGTAP